MVQTSKSVSGEGLIPIRISLHQTELFPLQSLNPSACSRFLACNEWVTCLGRTFPLALLREESTILVFTAKAGRLTVVDLAGTVTLEVTLGRDWRADPAELSR